MDRLYRQYNRLVFRTAYRLMGNFQEAEDLVQEIFLALWHRFPYDPRRGTIESFLRTLTRSRSIDRLRSQQASRRSLERLGKNQQSLPQPPAPLDRCAEEERSAGLRAALSQLPAPQRQVLELAYYAGLSQSTIARTCNAPLGTVKSWARQGQRNLRREIEKSGV
ncbi:sigma-70 family RNA polymerase sigma factor [Gloeobacter kilaueensis]|nr:sigma-70 family RNA polymerase sigma factor [Gloeobacter kilaueensis]